MQKVILFYKFVPLTDPEAIKFWQQALCQRLNLKGRIIIAKHGINGTLGGDINDLKSYVKTMKSFPSFKNMAFKWSDGIRDSFPRLSIKVRDEIVTFGASDEIKVDDKGIVGGGKHLKPKQVHELYKQRGEDVVFFDGRNAYEGAVGKFKDAVVPPVRHTRDFKKELDDPKYDSIKKRGFKEVYQIDGGIVKYGEEYKDDGLWEGSLYVFDDRLTTKFSDKAKDIGECSHCAAKTSNFINCADKSCNDLILVCESCQLTSHYCLSHFGTESSTINPLK
jgi:UPF0176 protein